MNELATFLKEGGPAAASVVMVLLFLRFMGQERDRSTKEREQMMMVITNHLEHTVATQTENSNAVVGALKAITRVIRKFCESKN